MADVAPVPPPSDLDKTTLSDVRLMLPLGELDETYTTVFDSGLFPPLYGNTTSSTKPEVRNISYCHQRRTARRSQVTCTKYLVKSGRALIAILALLDKSNYGHRRRRERWLEQTTYVVRCTHQSCNFDVADNLSYVTLFCDNYAIVHCTAWFDSWSDVPAHDYMLSSSSSNRSIPHHNWLHH